MGNVTFLGVEGSGKTVLTMALVNAFRTHEAEGWRLRPETRGAFRFLAQVPDTIAGETLPHQTTALRQLAWSVLFRDEPQRTLDILDYPGEVYRLAFLEAADDPNPASFAERVAANKEEIDALLGHLLRSEQVFVLFNLADATDLANKPANLDAVWTTNACLDYLHRLPSHPRITLLLTQIDRYVSLDAPTLDPRALVARHLPLIAKNFPTLDVLAISALGDADSTFGLDNLLLRCLIDTPAVGIILAALKETIRQIDIHFTNVCTTFSTSTISDLTTLLNRYHETLSSTKDCWLLTTSTLSRLELLLSSTTQRDFKSFRSLLYPLCQPQTKAKRVTMIGETLHILSQMRPNSKEGNKWRMAIFKQLSAQKDVFAKECTIERAWGIAACLIGVAVVILWVCVFRFA